MDTNNAELALSFYEEFSYLIENLKCINKENFEESHLETIIGGLEVLLEIIDEMPIKPVSTTKPSSKSVIENLNLGGEIVRLSIEGFSIHDIAVRFDLKDSSVRRFLTYYNKLSNSQKVKVRKTSVFNTTEQLEDLMVNIQQQLNRLQGNNDEIAVRYVGELRQTIQMAANLSQKIAGMHLYSQFTHAVMDILLTELPERRLEILERVKLLSSSTKLFQLPPSDPI